MTSQYGDGLFSRTVRFVGLVLIAGLFLASGCSDSVDPPDPPDPLDDEAQLTARLRADHDLQATPASIPYPDNNQPNVERIALGRLLFFDPILSGDLDVACATCHHPAFAWGDGRAVSIGVGGIGIGPDRVRGIGDLPTEFTTPRNSPTVLDAAFNRPFDGDADWEGRMFWDGRTSTLEDQARAPIRSRDEMRHDVYEAAEALTVILGRLQGIDEYVQRFNTTFPLVAAEVLDQFGPGQEELVINGDTYARAIAAYERELCSADSPFDRFANGDDAALSYSQKRGLDLFFKRGCAECHSGPMFSDYEFHALGVLQDGAGKPPIHEDGDGTDFGRNLETNVIADRYAFRTPTLRNVALMGPYFHTGGLGTGGDYETLRSIVEFHMRGGNDEGLTAEELDPLVRKVELIESEVVDLIAFMESLTATRLLSDRVDPTVPATVPSGLEPPPVLPPVFSNNFGGS